MLMIPEQSAAPEGPHSRPYWYRMHLCAELSPAPSSTRTQMKQSREFYGVPGYRNWIVVTPTCAPDAYRSVDGCIKAELETGLVVTSDLPRSVCLGVQHCVGR